MKSALAFLSALLVVPRVARCAGADTRAVRVFIFAGLDAPQDKVLFSYKIGREQKPASNGRVAHCAAGYFAPTESACVTAVASGGAWKVWQL